MAVVNPKPPPLSDEDLRLVARWAVRLLKRNGWRARYQQGKGIHHDAPADVFRQAITNSTHIVRRRLGLWKRSNPRPRPWIDHRRRAPAGETVIDLAKVQRLEKLHRRLMDLNKAGMRAESMAEREGERMRASYHRYDGDQYQSSPAWRAAKRRRGHALAQLARVSDAAVRVERAITSLGQGHRYRNPLPRARLLSRLERLHEAVSRNVDRKKPPSRRQIAIERAYERALRMYQTARRVNPMRRKNSRSKARGRRNPRASAAQMRMSFDQPNNGGAKKWAGALAGSRSSAKRSGGPKARPSTTPGRMTAAEVERYRAGLNVPAGFTTWLKKASTKVQGPKSAEEIRADKAYDRHLAGVRRAKKRKAEARAKRARAARKGAATRRKGKSRAGYKQVRFKKPGGGFRIAWFKVKGRKGGGRAKKKSTRRSSASRWSQMSRGKRFGRKIRAAVRGYGRSLKLRSRASISRKEHAAGLRAAANAFRRQNPRRRRRNPSALLVNPRGRRRNPAMRRRRRNPGLGGVVKQVLTTGLPAVGTAAALGAFDVKVLGKQPKIVSVLTKLGVGIAALVGLRNKPKLALPIAYAAFCTIGQDLGVKIAGGVTGGSTEAAAKALTEQAAKDPQALGVVLSTMQGMGVLQLNGAVDEAAAAFAGVSPIDANQF